VQPALQLRVLRASAPVRQRAFRMPDLGQLAEFAGKEIVA
jgi:hypothetical protein